LHPARSNKVRLARDGRQNGFVFVVFLSWTAGACCRCILLVEEKRNRSKVTPEFLLLVEMAKPRGVCVFLFAWRREDREQLWCL
jgi:hypothetical protein